MGFSGKLPLVLTHSTRAHLDGFSVWLQNEHKQPFILIGPEGCGKNILLQYCFSQLRLLLPTWQTITLNISIRLKTNRNRLFSSRFSTVGKAPASEFEMSTVRFLITSKIFCSSLKGLHKKLAERHQKAWLIWESEEQRIMLENQGSCFYLWVIAIFLEDNSR